MPDVKIKPMVFPQFTQPLGMLDPSRECQALWFYFSCAAGNYKDEKENIRLEGDKSRFNYFELYKNIAHIYVADPMKMQNYWPAVDLQAKIMNLTQLPKEQKYRSPGHLHAAIRPKTN